MSDCYIEKPATRLFWYHNRNPEEWFSGVVIYKNSCLFCLLASFPKLQSDIKKNALRNSKNRELRNDRRLDKMCPLPVSGLSKLLWLTSKRMLWLTTEGLSDDALGWKEKRADDETEFPINGPSSRLIVADSLGFIQSSHMLQNHLGSADLSL